MPISASANLSSAEKLVLATFILGNDKQRVDEINRTAFIRLSPSQSQPPRTAAFRSPCRSGA